MTRVLRVLALLIPLSLALSACDKEEPKDDAPKVDWSAQLGQVADAATAYAAAHDGLLPDTSVLVYCRSGGPITDEDSVFTTIGFTPSAPVLKGIFCFNVSSDHKKVGLTASHSAMAETTSCMILDLSGAEPTRSKVTESASCLP